MKDFLDYASKKYYEGDPIMLDSEFDKLAEEHNYNYVGAPVRDGVAHTFPMYSLKKCYVGEKMVELKGETIETPKLDGSAVSILYINGNYTLALTRGDGKRGQDVTDKVIHLVPRFIKYNGVTQIVGEVVAPKDIPNARNYAAGALNLKDVNEFLNRDLTFIAYGVQPSAHPLWTEDMEDLELHGFNTVCMGPWEEFPQDGKVIRINNNEIFEKAGNTASHPRGAYALKQRQEGVITRLISVSWQVGRTGVVSPVAILEPVKVGDAIVSRATLHNYRYIQERNLEIGCNVEIVRAGEIIPRVVRRV